jgi:hypothetical protein
MAFTGPYPTKFSGHTSAMVISATNFSGGVTNAGTIGAGGVTVISSTFLTGGFLNSNLISGAPTGIAVLSGSTIHGAIVDSGRIVATRTGILVSGGVLSSGISIAGHGTISAHSSAIVVRNAATFGGGISNSGTVASKSGAGILVRNITAFGNGSAGGISNSRGISAKQTGIGVKTLGAFFGSISNSGTISAGGAGILIDDIAEFTSGITNSGTISGHGGIFVELIANPSGGVVNRGTILAAGETAIGFDDDAVISGGVVNTGTIRAAQTGIVAITVSTFAGGITNIGTLSAGAVGIRLGSATIPQQYTVSSFTGDIVNSGTITAKTGITVIDSTILGAIVVSGNLLATSHGILIDSASQLSNTSRPGVRVTASKFLGGISNAGIISAITGIDVSRATTFTGGISNGGAITAVTGIAVGFNNGTPEKVSTFAGDIVNTGSISAGVAGIKVGITNGSSVNFVSVFTGNISNTGAISGATGIALIGVQSASVFDAGTIVGTGGTAIEFSGGGNTLTLGAGYVISGDVEASGNNAFRLGGTGSDTFDLNSIGTQYSGFTSFSVVGGHWSVGGIGGAWVVSSGTFELTSGTVVSNTVVQSGGTEIVDSGGGGLTTTVSKGGVEVAIAGGSGSAGILSGGTLEFVGSGANQNFSATFNAGATLEVGSLGSLIDITSGAVVNGGLALIGNGIVEIAGPSGENVQFLSTGSGGLKIADTAGHTSAFSGRVSGFGGSGHLNPKQFIDLVSVMSAGVITSSYVSANGANTSGTLFISSGGTMVAAIKMVGSYSVGDFHVTSGAGGTVAITDPMVPNGGSVAPGPAHNFPRGGVDLPNIAFGAQTTLAYAENAAGTGGTLTVSDGRHAASIALLGNYIAGSFVIAADGHGGTLISEVQQTEQKPQLAHPAPG